MPEMASDITNNFGIKKVQPEGDVVFGKVLNDALDEIDARLYEALFTDKVQDEGIKTGFDATALAMDDVYEEVALDDQVRIRFGRDVDLDRVRVKFEQTGGTTGTVSFSVAKAGGVVPLTADIDFTGSGDQTVLPSGVTRVTTAEELILIAKRTTGCDLTGNIRLVVVGDVAFTGE
jgi:hypothetical protein